MPHKEFKDLDKNNIWFTSDTHFGHENIIKYCNRPFKDVKEMNQRLVDNWNAVVPKDGMVFHLGDFAMGLNVKSVMHILNSLNGNIVLCCGNHEGDVLTKKHTRDLFHSIHGYLDIKILDEEVSDGFQRITLCHYPMITWNHEHRGSWQLYGHLHKGLNFKPTQLEVGVDCHNYDPISYEQVKVLITKQHLGK